MTDENTPINRRQYDTPVYGAEQPPTTGEALLAIARAIESLSVDTREQTAATTRATDRFVKAIDRTTGVGFDYENG